MIAAVACCARRCATIRKLALAAAALRIAANSLGSRRSPQISGRVVMHCGLEPLDCQLACKASLQWAARRGELSRDAPLDLWAPHLRMVADARSPIIPRVTAMILAIPAT